VIIVALCGQGVVDLAAAFATAVDREPGLERTGLTEIFGATIQDDHRAWGCSF